MIHETNSEANCSIDQDLPSSMDCRGKSSKVGEMIDEYSPSVNKVIPSLDSNSQAFTLEHQEVKQRKCLSWQHFQNAIDINPLNQAALVNWGWLAVHFNEFSIAKRNFLLAFHRHPAKRFDESSVSFLLNVGYFYYRFNRDVEASRFFVQALQTHPSSGWAAIFQDNSSNINSTTNNTIERSVLEEIEVSENVGDIPSSVAASIDVLRTTPAMFSTVSSHSSSCLSLL